MKIRTFLLLTMLLALASPALGQYIEIRVSIKIIRDPLTNAWPANITEDLFRPNAQGTNPNNTETNANRWMANYARGYRFRITEIVPIGGPTEQGPNGVNCFYGTDPRAAGNGPSCWFGNVNALYDPAFEMALRANPSLFRVSNSAINFYVAIGKAVPAGSGGACPIPPGEADKNWCHGFVNEGAWWLVHETGHFFGLYHTHDDTCGNVGTLDDNLNWMSRDDVFNRAEQTNCMGFNSLSSAAQQKLVDDTYYNVMSYHEAAIKDTVEDRMTELQLDKHADFASTTRNDFVTGKTHFISTAGSDTSGSGRSTNPYRTLSKGLSIANAAGGDTLLLRAGVYTGVTTINQKVTLRAGRGSVITLGQ